MGHNLLISYSLNKIWVYWFRKNIVAKMALNDYEYTSEREKFAVHAVHGF